MTRTVSSRWDVAAAKVDVVELDNELSTQRELCDSIVKEKDDMVTQLQTALKAKDDEYVRNLRAQAADIDTIIAYMNDQVNNSKNSKYSTYLFRSPQITWSFCQLCMHLSTDKMFLLIFFYVFSKCNLFFVFTFFYYK